MQLAALAARDHAAQLRLVAAAEKLGERFGVETGVRVRRMRSRDPRVQAMHQREALATFLEALVGAESAEVGITLEDLEKVPGIGKATLIRIAKTLEL